MKKSDHIQTGQKDPTDKQFAGNENRGQTFVSGRETQNQKNPGAQPAKFNTLTEVKEERDQTFDNNAEIKETEVENIDEDEIE